MPAEMWGEKIIGHKPENEEKMSETAQQCWQHHLSDGLVYDSSYLVAFFFFFLIFLFSF